MKKNLLVGLLSVGIVASAFSQGTVVFNNLNSASGLKAPIYGPETVNPGTSLIQGNTSAGLPAGTAVYTGPLLSTPNYIAQLWAAPTTGTAIVPDASLVGAANPTTIFRTGTAAGYVTQITSTLAGVPLDSPVATLQLRVWDNTGGVNSWDAAVARGVGFGKSISFNVSAIGGTLNPAPLLVGLTSFNVTGGPIVPEPSTFALAGIGAAALLIFRRRK